VRFSAPRQELNVYFENSGGVVANAPVRFNGYEVGRVKSVRSVRMTAEHLERIGRTLTPGDLDHLPLRTTAARKALVDTPAAEFHAAALKTIEGQTLVEVTLEVERGGDSRRFRVDDRVRVAATIFGDASVEIASGSGALNTAENPRALLGQSGDFFSALARGMGDVKEILGGVTEIVSADERRGFERATSRLSGISSRIEKMTESAGTRSDATAARFDEVEASARGTVDRADKVFATARESALKTRDGMKDAVKDVKTRADRVRQETSEVSKDIQDDLKTVKADLKSAMETVEPDLQSARTNLRKAYDGANGLSERFDGMKSDAGALAARAEPDLARAVPAFKNSIVNLRQAGEAANLNKDLMLGNSDKGEHEYFTAQDIHRKLVFSTRQIIEAAGEVGETRRALEDQLAGKLVLELARTTEQEIRAVHGPVEEVRGKVEAVMLPEFERKKAGWK
jgi:ABC-type transporter Mla subunit MlaD